MFDDYVEHAGASQDLPIHAPSALPRLNYEGFEPTPDTPEDIRADEALRQMDDPAPDDVIFELDPVQYTFPAPLIAFAVSSDMLVMALASNMLVFIELSHSEQVIQIPIPRKPSEFTIYKCFIDPSGRHVLVSSTTGENWYYYRNWKKPKQLKSFKMLIESIAWNKTALLSGANPTSTREMLIGARDGTIYEAVLDAEDDFFKSQERYLQLVFTLPERRPITGISFNFYPPADLKKALVVVTTPSRIYQFVGAPDRRSDDRSKVFSGLFGSYRDTAPKILELPGNIPHSELHFFTPNAGQAQSLPKTMAWLTGPGIYHGTMNFQSATDDLIDATALLPYPQFTDSSSNEPPLSMAVTEFHFVLLYRDRIAAVCRLDDSLAYEEALPIRTEEVLGISADPVRGTYWVYTDKSLFELAVKNDSRDVWKIFLQQNEYEHALRYAKTAVQRDLILSAQARAFFEEGRFFQAAQIYARCSVSFEEVTLKFLDAGERDSLRSYLVSRLERTRKSDLTQRMMLATWLIEFYLSKCNELDDLVASESLSHDARNVQTERDILEEELRQFLQTYKNDLDRDIVYELIQGHGRTDMYLFYMTVVGDSARVIEHWITEEEWLNAVAAISSQSDLELYYRFSSVLICNAPTATVDAWLRQPALDPIRLIPALLQLQHLPRDPLSPNQAIRYLTHVIFQQNNTSPTIHNLLITFFVSSSPLGSSPAPEDDTALLRFLSTAPSDLLTGKPYYDLDYALRLCKQSGRIQACVHIYSKMGLWENSVDLALQKGDLELATLNADMPEGDQVLRKKLWLKIARYVVQDKKDIKAAMRFLENTDLLKIEDILPFFPDFIVIDDFKEEIARALEGYSAHIEELKLEMDEATRTAESIKQDIAALQTRFVTIDANELCSSCSQQLITRQFYVFPCRHSFHVDCLIGLAKEYLPSHVLRRILALQNELVTASGVDITGIALPSPAANGHQKQQRSLLSASFSTTVANPSRAAQLLGRNVVSAGDKLRELIIPDALAAAVAAPVAWIPGVGGGAQKAGVEKLDSKRIEALRADLDDLLSSNCPLCESVIVGLDKPFIEESEMDTTWVL
ncbi:hypothetical protein FISHEDRAFT_76299 [Fistulina hepatica ATCC 64428]|uniref:Pep3/Vps18/deep orange domain-containing protein n=1 Tax=Fistulina hepatica ATCC 64428 TaxID=1128425 RepID=A0A0D7A4S8_9AGAR|nr:hypothetical protein FISHEDRAFT_76299 [Fistulina hepatica ATCC 64428]